MFNEKAERINGWFAMIGIVAAMGSYLATGQIIPGVW
ncbi:high light inducible protein [Synechococcus phage DSL-LC02]|nr:high light inducible protein [Synechococcus phage DSL-LC02]